MRKLMATILVVSLATSSTAFAASSSKEENVGAGSGAVIGALAGGPVGLIIGAAIGAKIGDKMKHKNDTIVDSMNDVSELEKDIQALNRDIDSLSLEVEHYQENDRPELISLMQAGIAMDLLFRTDEYVLADTTGERLSQLANGMAGMSDIHVQLDGFADERGDAEYNLELSDKRVRFVRDQLISAGMDPARIRVAAHGEAPAQDDSFDSYALERRVSLKLFIDSPQPLAASSN